jgi:hypothetical protein
MRPDAILCWPNDVDYPLWREFLLRERARLGRVLIVFTEHHDGYDYRDFIRANVDAECFDSPYPNGRDWRDVAVNFALDKSDSEWVWFTEQDFRITDPERYWAIVDTARSVAGFVDSTARLHPASLYVRRVIVEETSRYFGPVPIDHFYRFSQELPSVYRWLEGFTHMQGLSHNHFLTENGIDEGVFKRDEFRAYLAEALRADVPLEPHWVEMATRELERAG